VKEPEVPVGGVLDQREERLVEKSIPMLDRFRSVAREGESVMGRAGKEMPCPDLGNNTLAPAAGEGAHQSGLAEPGAGFSLEGRALVTQEGDKPPVAEGLVGGAHPDLVVEDRGLVERTDMIQEPLAGSLVGGPCHSDRVGSEVVEDSGEPLPISMVHGKEEGGPTALGPGRGDVAQGREIQLVPSSGQKQEAFPERVAEQVAREPRGRCPDPTSQLADCIGAGDGAQAHQRCCGREQNSLAKGGAKG
jgi:hypothetical protein